MPYERATAVRSTAVTDSLDSGSFTFNMMHLNTQLSLPLTVQLIFVVAHRVAISEIYGRLNSLFAVPYLPSLGAMSSKEEYIFYKVQLPVHPLETESIKKESL